MSARSGPGSSLDGMELDRESGSVQLSGAAARLYLGWQAYLMRLLAPHVDEVIVGPELVTSRTLEETGYSENFPHQLVAIEPTTYLPPAACLSTYPLFRQRRLPASLLVIARCGRVEGGRWEPPFRLRTFTMLEAVLAGPLSTVKAQRERLAETISSALDRLGLHGSLEIATDAFFLGERSGAQMIQRLKGLKREYLAALPGGSAIAVCSINNHERYFMERFKIGTDDTESTCVAFGLERLTALGLLAWGPDPADWPADLRQ